MKPRHRTKTGYQLWRQDNPGLIDDRNNKHGAIREPENNTGYLSYKCKTRIAWLKAGRTVISHSVLSDGIFATYEKLRITQLLHSKTVIQERYQSEEFVKELATGRHVSARIRDVVCTTVIDIDTQEEIRVSYEPPIYPDYLRPSKELVARARNRKLADARRAHAARAQQRATQDGERPRHYIDVPESNSTDTSNLRGAGWRKGHIDPMSTADPYRQSRIALWQALVTLAVCKVTITD